MMSHELRFKTLYHYLISLYLVTPGRAIHRPLLGYWHQEFPVWLNCSVMKVFVSQDPVLLLKSKDDVEYSRIVFF